MTPKFAVGEVVILQSRQLPQFNGEHTVRQVLTCNDIREDRAYYGKFVRWTSDKVGYILEEIFPLGTTSEGHPCEVTWHECALRKKQQPGEISFDKLMSSLSQPVQEPSYT